MGQTLYDCLMGQALRMYLADDLREQAMHTVAVESPRGWRIAKQRASAKIDGIVALAMACVAALESKPDPRPWWTLPLEEYEKMRPEGPRERFEREQEEAEIAEALTKIPEFEDWLRQHHVSQRDLEQLKAEADGDPGKYVKALVKAKKDWEWEHSQRGRLERSGILDLLDPMEWVAPGVARPNPTRF
jgi:hypothetical protein